MAVTNTATLAHRRWRRAVSAAPEDRQLVVLPHTSVGKVRMFLLTESNANGAT